MFTSGYKADCPNCDMHFISVRSFSDFSFPIFNIPSSLLIEVTSKANIHLFNFPMFFRSPGHLYSVSGPLANDPSRWHLHDCNSMHRPLSSQCQVGTRLLRLRRKMWETKLMSYWVWSAQQNQTMQAFDGHFQTFWQSVPKCRTKNSIRDWNGIQYPICQYCWLIPIKTIICGPSTIYTFRIKNIRCPTRNCQTSPQFHPIFNIRSIRPGPACPALLFLRGQNLGKNCKIQNLKSKIQGFLPPHDE